MLDGIEDWFSQLWSGLGSLAGTNANLGSYQSNLGTSGDGAQDGDNGAQDGNNGTLLTNPLGGLFQGSSSSLSGLEPWAIGAAVLIGLFLLVALVHEVREV